VDPFRFTTIAHATHELCNPIDSPAFDRFIEFMRAERGLRVLDAGCGKGEALIRVARKWDARGIGMDINPAFLRLARRHAAERAPGAALEWIESRVTEAGLEPASFDLVICIGSVHVFGDLPDALRAIHALTRPGGQMILGHGYWKQEPDPDYLLGFGATRDELGSHQDNLDAVQSAGFNIDLWVRAMPEDWDAYEGQYAGNVERFFAEHPDDPDRDEFLNRIRSWHALYRKWGRDTMGFAMYRARRL
jgi:SAM-dependent methyltransferase